MRPGEEAAPEGVGDNPTDHVTLEVTHIRPWGLTFISIGAVLLGTAAMVNAVDDWIDSRNAESRDSAATARINRLNDIIDKNEIETDCRAALTATVGNLESERTGHLAAGLVAVVQEDEPALDVHILALEEIEARLVEARDARANANEVCSRPNPPGSE